MKDKTLTTINIINILISILGIILLLVSITLFTYDYILEKKALTVTATIKNLDFKNNSNSAMVGYNIEGKYYENYVKLKRNSKLTVQDQISIKVDMYNPTKLIKNNHTFLAIIILILAVILLVLKLPATIKYFKKSNNNKKLMTTGLSINAIITDVFVNNKIKQHKGKYPYRLRCQYTNPVDNQLYIFESDDTYNDLNSFIKENGTNQIQVYIDRGNTNNYYVNYSSLIPKINVIDPIEFMKKENKSIQQENPEAVTSNIEEASVVMNNSNPNSSKEKQAPKVAISTSSPENTNPVAPEKNTEVPTIKNETSVVAPISETPKIVPKAQKERENNSNLSTNEAIKKVEQPTNTTSKSSEE